MQAIRTSAFLRTVANALGALLLVPLLAACPKGDVGAPCNHGDVEPPDAQVITFPALSCNDLICVYADSRDPPDSCANDMACNVNEEDGNIRYQCINNTCKLSPTFVLERSMCSKTCGSDDDCKDGGLGKQVQAKDSSCLGGFKCVQLQKLGEFCCQKLCVCDDDLSQDVIDKLAEECAAFPVVDGKPVCPDAMMGPPPVDMTGTT